MTLMLGSPAKLVNKPVNAPISHASRPLPLPTGLSSPFAPKAAYFPSSCASPKGLFGSPIALHAGRTPPGLVPRLPLNGGDGGGTPNCPPPVLLGADSCPRFPTPPQMRDSPVSIRAVAPAAEPPEGRGRSVDKGARSVLGRLRSKSRSGKDRPPAPASQPDASPTKPAPARERRFSLSDKLSSVLKRKARQEHDAPPPLPAPSRVKASVSSNKLAAAATPQRERALARSASSPDLSRKQSWKADGPLPPLPTFGAAFAAASASGAGAGSPFMRPVFATPPLGSTYSAAAAGSPSSVPSLSPASSQAASFASASPVDLHTPSFASPAGFPSSPVVTPDRETLEASYFPYATPAATQWAAEATPQAQTVAGDLAALGLEAARSGGSDDVPLAVLKAQRAGPFQFVPAEMSKKPLKKGRSTPDLRQPFKRPPSPPSGPYFGHPLLPQSDDKRRRPAEPLPLFVEQSVLAMNT